MLTIPILATINSVAGKIIKSQRTESSIGNRGLEGGVEMGGCLAEGYQPIRALCAGLVSVRFPLKMAPYVVWTLRLWFQ